MKKIKEEDLLFLKSFLKRPTANFIKVLDLRYENDYFIGLGLQIMKDKSKLNCRVEDISEDTERRILDYLKTNASSEDIIYYQSLKLAHSILQKYCDEEGNREQ